jgi:NAD(P)-dependent dehydrogenase (short-subunit alcohol dehydrogenase family)
MGLDAFEDVLQVNLTPCYQLTRLVLPGMRKKKSGRIVYVSSINATHGTPGLPAYAAAKAGLNGFMVGTAVEVAKDGILVNSVAPGYILTPGLLSWIPAGDGDAVNEDSLFPDSKRIIPLGSLSQLRGPILWLASDENSYITGQCLMADGGQSRAANQLGLWPGGAP